MLELYKKIVVRLTSDKILQQSSFEQPYIISPEQFKSFQHLLNYFHEIRDLKLVPVKDDAMYEKYHLLDKTLILEHLNKMLTSYDIFILKNQFPYWLSEDVNQRIIWMRNDISKAEILKFISKIITVENLNVDECIFFERPCNISTKLVKGTVPEIRHIHFWTKA